MTELYEIETERLLLRQWRDGDWVGLRRSYKQGTLIVLASPDPLTNAGLADASTARFVFRQVVAPSIGGGRAPCTGAPSPASGVKASCSSWKRTTRSHPNVGA